MANPATNVRLFEVNLIGDRISKFFRRRTLQKWCTVGAAVMLLIAVVMAIRIVLNVSKSFAVNSAIRADVRQIQKDEEGVASLDKLKQDVLAHVQNVAPLLAIADAKVYWAPKLVALADASPPGASLMTFQGIAGGSLWRRDGLRLRRRGPGPWSQDRLRRRLCPRRGQRRESDRPRENASAVQGFLAPSGPRRS